MPVPSYSVGQVLPSADVNTWFLPLAAAAVTDQSTTNSSATPVNDNTLSVALAASANYQVELFLRYNTTSTTVAAGQFTGPSGATLSLTAVNIAAANDINLSGAFFFGPATNGVDFASAFIGSIVTSSTAGTLQFQFWSGTGGSSVTRRARSRLVLRRTS